MHTKQANLLKAIGITIATIAAALCIFYPYIIGNKDVVDTVYRYDEAIVSLADGSTVQGQVETWTDYEDGDQIQVTIDGVTYLVHSTNVTLISYKKGE